MEDPGWEITPASVLVSATLLWRLGSVARDPSRDRLVLLRHAYVGFWLGGFLVIAVAAAIGTLPEQPRPVLATALTSAVGLAAVAAVLLVPRRVDCSSRAAVSDSFVVDLMSKSGWANVPLLAGFALAISMGEWWVTLVGALWSALAQYRLVPTRSRIAQRADDLAAGGCTVPLIDALRGRDVPPTER